MHMYQMIYEENGIKFPLNYYYLPYNEEIAKKIIGYVKPMLTLYQKDFGPYPFSARWICTGGVAIWNGTPECGKYRELHQTRKSKGHSIL